MDFKQGDSCGEAECPSCAGKGEYKISKNGTIYFYCTQIIIPDIREKCGFRAFFGRHQSELIKQEYLQNVQQHQAKTANIEPERGDIETPKPEPEPQAQPISDARKSSIFSDIFG